MKNERIKKIYTHSNKTLSGHFEITNNFNEADLVVIDHADDLGKLASEKPILLLGHVPLEREDIFQGSQSDLQEISDQIYCALNALNWVGVSSSARFIRRILFTGVKEKFVIVVGAQGVGKSFFCALYALRPNNLIPVSFDFSKLKNIFSSQQLVNYVQAELSAERESGNSKIYLVLMENFNALDDLESESILDAVLKVSQKNPMFQAVITSAEVSGKIEQLKYLASAKVIYVPPLKERKEDLEKLLKSFNPSMNISEEALEVMLAYSWPLNCLELKTLAKEENLTIERLDDKMFEARVRFSIQHGILTTSGQVNVLKLRLKKAFVVSRGSFKSFCDYLNVSQRTGSFLARKFDFRFT